MIELCPSILSADFSILGKEVEEIRKCGIKSIHIDVMDGHFVPNISIGSCIVKSIRRLNDLYFDVHLMIENPKKYIASFIEAGADGITFHLETVSENINSIINLIKSSGKRVGVSVNPETELPSVEILEKIDVLLIMSVNPGFGGQEYISRINDKIKKARKVREDNDLSFKIEVDGGINSNTINEVVESGADIIVAGNAIFGKDDRKKAIEELMR